MFRTTAEWQKLRKEQPTRNIETTNELITAALHGRGKNVKRFIVCLIEYSFDIENADDVEFSRYLDSMREVGTAEVTSVQLVEKEC